MATSRAKSSQSSSTATCRMGVDRQKWRPRSLLRADSGVMLTGNPRMLRGGAGGHCSSSPGCTSGSLITRDALSGDFKPRWLNMDELSLILPRIDELDFDSIEVGHVVHHEGESMSQGCSCDHAVVHDLLARVVHHCAEPGVLRCKRGNWPLNCWPCSAHSPALRTPSFSPIGPLDPSGHGSQWPPDWG